MTDQDLTEFHALTEAEELRKVVSDLEARLRRAKARTEDLVKATLDGARSAMIALGPITPVTPPAADRRKSTAEIALWHLTDWQGAKVTTTYNSQVMQDRVARFCERATRLTEIQRADHPVRKGVILFGGDMQEGLFNFPAQPFQVDATLFGQFIRVARLEAQVVRHALSLYDEVEVWATWGNHGRFGSKRAVVPESDNLDRMIGQLAREQLAGETRLTWHEDEQRQQQQVQIGNYRALLIHGDEIGRNGYASPATIVGHVAKWKSGAWPWPFQDTYMGHYHNHQEWSLPDGRGAVYMTGAPESDNRYARDTMAAAALPSQRLHFVEPDAGLVTAQYKVWVA